MAAGLVQGVIHARLHDGRLVIELEQGHLATLSVDGAKVTDDAAQDLRLAAVADFIHAAFDKLAHLGLHLIEQVARQKEAQGYFFFAQALLHAPRGDGHRIGLTGARSQCLRVSAVKQAALMGMRLHAGGKIKGAVDAGHQAGTVQIQVVESARLDQGLHAALVDTGAVDAHTKIKQTGEVSSRLPRRHDGLDGLLAGATHRPQAITDHGVGDRLKPVPTAVDVRWLKGQSHFDGVFKQHFELVGVVHLHRHVGAEKLHRVVHLEPGRVIGQQRISSGMRLVEAVSRKALHQVENFIRFGLSDAVFGRTVGKNLAVLRHLFGFFLAHGTAQ